MKTPFNNNTLILIILASILCINYNAFVAAADKKVTRNLTTTQTKQTAVITSVIVIDAFGKQISPPNSSWDGRAQIIVKGENLTELKAVTHCVMKLVPITNPSEELVGCTPNNLNDPSCLTVVFNVLTNELHCYTPMIPYVKRSAIKNNTSYQLFLRTTNGNAFTDITCSNSNLCIVNYSKDLTPSIVSISPQYFYFGQHIQFRIIPITFNEGIEVKKIGNYSINHALSGDIKIGNTLCKRINDISNETPKFIITDNSNPQMPKGYWDVFLTCRVDTLLSATTTTAPYPESVPTNGLIFPLDTGIPTFSTFFYKTGLNIENPINTFKSEELSFKSYPYIYFTSNEGKDTKGLSVYPDKETTVLFKAYGLGPAVKSDTGVINTIDTGVQLYLNDSSHPCVIDSKNTSLCKVNKISDTMKAKIIDSQTKWLGGPGIHYRKFKIQDIYNLDRSVKIYGADIREYLHNLPTGIPSDNYISYGVLGTFSLRLIQNSVFLEGSTQLNQSYECLEYFNGWFKVPKTTSYRFYIKGQKVSIYLTDYPSTGTRTRVLDSKSEEEFSQDKVSQWLDLVEGNYYMEIYHSQGYNTDLFSWGIEIKESGVKRNLKLEEEEKHLELTGEEGIDSDKENLKLSFLKDTEDKSKRNLVSTNTNTKWGEAIVTRFQKVSIKPRVVYRDIYEILTPEPNTEYTFSCLDPSLNPSLAQRTFTFNNQSINIQTFRMEIAKVIDEVNIYVEKIPINEQSQYMSDNGDFKSASDGNGLSATSFSVNPQNSKNIKNRTTIGTSTGYSFLIYINKSASLRSRDYAKALNTQNDCVIYKKVANDTQIPITRIQTVSPVLSGYYKLTYQFNASPFQYVSEPISAAYNTNPFDTLNKIPTLTNKIQIFLQNKGEDEILYYIKIVDRLKNLTIDSFSFTPITSQSSSSSNTSNVITTLKGGTDGIETPITTIQDWPIATGSDIPFTNVFNSDVRPNEFIFPLTADFLAVKVFKPALKIFNNGVEAVCLFDNVTGLNECEISYLTNCPKVNDYYYDTATKLVYIWEHSQAVNDCNVGNTTSKLIGFLYDNKTRIATLSFDSDYYYIPDNTTIYFLNLVTLSRDMLCTYIASASDKRSLTCKLENLVVGKYYPLLLTPFGYVNSVNFSTAIPKIEPTIIEFEPIQNIQENTDQDLNTCIIAAKGTTNVVISGSNFPILSTACVDGKCPLDNLIVTFGGYRCFAKSSSLTTISCDITPDTLVTSTTPTENFTVKYNDVSVVDQKKSCVWSATDVKDNNTQLQYILEISLGVSLPAATIILVILLWFFCYHKKRLKREEQARLQELEDAKKSGGIIYETVAKTDNGAITEMGVQNSSNRSDEKSFDAKPNFVDISPVPKRPDRLLSGKKKLGKLDSGKSINTINTNKPLKGFMKEETESVETDQNNQDRQDRQDNNHTDNPKRRRIESIFPGQEKGESSDKLKSGDIIDDIQEKPTNKNISVSKSNVTKKVEKVGNININSANSGGVNNAEMPNNENHQNGEKDKDVDMFENERKDTADRILDDGNRI